MGSAPSCRTGGGEALRRLKLDTSTPVRVSPRTPRANSVAAIADRWPRRTDGCANFSWCDLLTEDTRLCQRVFVEVSRLSAKRSILAKLDNFDFIYFKIRCFIRLLRHTPCRQRGTVRGRELGMGLNGSWTSGFGEWQRKIASGISRHSTVRRSRQASTLRVLEFPIRAIPAAPAHPCDRRKGCSRREGRRSFRLCSDCALSSQQFTRTSEGLVDFLAGRSLLWCSGCAASGSVRMKMGWSKTDTRMARRPIAAGRAQRTGW